MHFGKRFKVAITLSSLMCVMGADAVGQESYMQPWRPQYHFTPAKNFMNDPNGMVFYKGEYHLFFQYNPQGQVWGHMSWGHAVSTDMVHWKELGVAIPEDANYMIYSGSAVVDWNNSSGLCRSADAKDQSCLIAIYAAAYKNLQKTHIAYSNDRGRTWTNYAGNPVIDVGAEDFRDPYVFWYEPEKKWMLVAVLADHRKALFFSSQDLKKWTKLSEFGPAGDDSGQWECPLLLDLQIEGSDEHRGVLVINRNPGAPAGGTGVRYLIGHFDGSTFTEKESAGKKLWADYGKDFYATNVFNDMQGMTPTFSRKMGKDRAAPVRRVWVGWTSNWLYAKDEPTESWRGAQSIPRSLGLRWVGVPMDLTVGGGQKTHSSKNGPGGAPAPELLMVQAPVRELQKLRSTAFILNNASVQEAKAQMTESLVHGGAYEIEAELEPGAASEIGFKLRKGDGVETIIGVIPATNMLFVDRTKSGDMYFNDQFSGRFITTLSETRRVKLHIFVDRSIVEVFANDGEKVMTDRIYPPADCSGIEVYSQGGGRIVSMTVWPMGSAWK